MSKEDNKFPVLHHYRRDPNDGMPDFVEWSALSEWSTNYFAGKVGSKNVAVSIIPKDLAGFDCTDPGK